MEYVGYYNGETGPLEELKVPMLDRAVFFGDCCYDMATFRNRRAFALKDHLNRFYSSCRQLDIHVDLTMEKLAAEIPDSFIKMGVAPAVCEASNINNNPCLHAKSPIHAISSLFPVRFEA